MDKIGIVMPVWMQEQSILDMTLQSLATIHTPCIVYMIPSRLRLELIEPADLQYEAHKACQQWVKLLYTPGVERTVSGCWNAGVAGAIRDGCNYIMIQANDVRLRPSTIEQLVQFGENHPEIDLWSATHDLTDQPPTDSWVSSADFSCFMTRPTTFTKHGRFDEKFRPAYFEDNDYYGRIILGGGQCAQVLTAKMEHLGSQTIKNDPEAAHHVQHWFRINERRFLDKWCTPRVAQNPDEVLQLYSKHPWGDTSKPLTWWDRD